MGDLPSRLMAGRIIVGNLKREKRREKVKQKQ